MHPGMAWIASNRASIPHEGTRVISKRRASEPLAGVAGPSATRTLRTALRRPRLAAADLVTPGFVAQACLENISGRLLYQRAPRGPAEIRQCRIRNARERGSERLRRGILPSVGCVGADCRPYEQLDPAQALKSFAYRSAAYVSL